VRSALQLAAASHCTVWFDKSRRAAPAHPRSRWIRAIRLLALCRAALPVAAVPDEIQLARRQALGMAAALP